MSGPLVTNLRHTTIRFEDHTSREFLVLADGTRSRDQIAERLSEVMRRRDPAATSVTREDIDRFIEVVRRLGLFIA